MKSTIEKAHERKRSLMDFIADEIEKLKSSVRTRIDNLDEGEIRQMSEFITQRKAANILDVSVPTLRKYTKMGVFKQHRLGTKVYYREDEIFQVFE